MANGDQQNQQNGDAAQASSSSFLDQLKAKMKSPVAWVIVAVELIVLSFIVHFLLAVKQPADRPEESIFYVPPGAAASRVAELATVENLSPNPFYFRAYLMVAGVTTQLKSGEFVIPATASMIDVVDILVAGKAYQRKITIPEGLNNYQLHQLMHADDLYLSGPLDYKAMLPEGRYLPETYAYERGDTVADLLVRMNSAMEKALQEAWSKRPDDFALKTKEELLAFASIIEKETAIDSERAMVSAVFHNRLKKGMRLQSDPTVIYAATGGIGVKRHIMRSDLKRQSPYNTYRVHGLPPGPIANPGKASIMAAIRPASVDYLYFVADGTGGHKFAKTLREHNRNVAAWRKIKNAGAQ